jgi:hypothetical protein
LNAAVTFHLFIRLLLSKKSVGKHADGIRCATDTIFSEFLGHFHPVSDFSSALGHQVHQLAFVSSE